MALPPLLPWPRSFVTSPDRCYILDTGAFDADPESHALAVQTELVFGTKHGAGGVPLKLRLDPSLDGGPEAYRLLVRPDEIVLTGATPAGVFYALQTLRQLVSGTGPIECVDIVDAPRFGWRGALVDVGRHFMPIPDLRRFIDAMARYKLNVLHLHLTEDQGWRIEIKKYPRLTEVGSIRKETMAGHYEEQRFDGKPHGGFYTQDELRDLVAYAAERFVTIVPEIELPGHSQAAIAAYPELGCTGEQLEVRTAWGVSENIYNPSAATLRFLEDVLDEVLDIFPSTFIHIGGDEAPKVQWKASPVAQARMKEFGLKDEDELQSWFIGHFGTYLAARGRRLIGWDEILEGGLPADATVMSWRGEEGGIAAAKAGHDVVMAPHPYVYFDQYQSRDKAAEPVGIGGYTNLRKVYDYEPVPSELTEKEAKHVLGAQGELWTEYIPTPSQLEYMAFPRLLALAEVLWTPADRKDFESFWKRVNADLPRLAAQGVNYRKLDEEQREPPRAE